MLIPLESYQWVRMPINLALMVEMLVLLLREHNSVFHLDTAGRQSVSSTGGVKKRGRGRPPKSANSSKVSASAGVTKAKRGRGRPPKSGGAAAKKAPVTSAKRAVSPAKNDGNQRKRGRPSKSNVSNEQVRGSSKPPVSQSKVPAYRKRR